MGVKIMYFTVENCTPDQLDELRGAYFWADDTDPETLIGINFPGDVPNWLLFQQYARILFTDDDFFCTAYNVMIQAYDGSAWHKVATYTRGDAERYLTDPEYIAALVAAGFPENVTLRIAPIE